MSNKFNFLNNKPIGKDLFEGQSQERISEALVKTLNDKNFQIIGIDGEWGTGKSNLVDIVSGKLEDSHSFFIYDVWGHQEDEQRRSILIELTQFIEEKKIIKKVEKWKEKLKKLLGKEREVTTINRPYLSVGFILSLLSIIYIPTVNTFVKSEDGYTSFKEDWWMVLVILFPILLVLVIYLWNVGYHFFSRKEKRNSFKIALEQTFQVYTNKQEEETKIETIIENNPSVREFREWMTEVDEDLKKHKLVIVIDNFDRLPKKHIQNIWSSIHIFFAEEEYDNIKVIIPFDREHIKNAFGELNGRDEKEQDYANDYINKTFDIVYRVSPPIMSSWKAYFEDHWKTAFPDYDKIEFLKSEQAYEVFRPKITPRGIIAFINEVVSIKLLDDTIPDRYISVFVLNKEWIIKNPLKAVTDLSYLKGMWHVYKDDTDFQKYITALAYQIEPENALEVVYKKELKNCLMNGDDKQLNEIAKTSVFDKIIGSVLNEIELKNNAQLIETLSKLNEKNASISALKLQNIWDEIYLKEKDEKIENIEIEGYLTILLDKISDEYKPYWLQKIVNHTYSANSEFSSQTFTKYIDELDSFCSEDKIELDVFKCLKNKKTGVEQFKALVETKKEDYIKYRLTCSKDEIETYLEERTAEDFREAEFIFHLGYKYELNDFHEKLKTFVAPQSNQPDFLSNVYAFLKQTTNQPIDSPLTDVHLYTLMKLPNIAEHDFYVGLACMRIKLGNSSHPSYQSIYNKALNSQDEEFHKKVAEEIEYYVSLEDLLITSIEFQKPLIKGVVQLVLEKENEKRNVSVKTIIENLIEICESNEIEEETIFMKLDKHDNTDEYDFDFVSNLDQEFFQLAKSSKSNIAKELIDIYTKHFKEANNTIWEPVFNDLDSKELNILLTLGFKDWNSFALENLKGKLVEIVREGDNGDLDIINPLIESFEESGKSLVNTFKDVRGEFISRNNMSVEHFKVLTPLLFKYGSLEEEVGNVVRTIFKNNILDDTGCVDIMLGNEEGLKKLFDKCKKTEKSDFIEAVKDRRGTGKIEQLAEILKIKMAKQKIDN